MYLVVGSGLTGATIARLLFDAGKDVQVVEERNDIGGNVHDYTNLYGIRCNSYGPHYFRTDNEDVLRFVKRFAKWYPFSASLRAVVDGQLENYPPTSEYVRRVGGSDDVLEDKNNFESVARRKVTPLVYKNFISEYTRRQWGVAPSELSADLASRVELRDDTDNRLSKKKHQILPYLGYTEFVHKLLDGIPLTTNYRWTPVIEDWQIRSPNGARVIYTGPLDVLFDNCFGSLKYRSMERVTLTMLVGFGKFLQPTVQTNYPQGDRLYLRSIEWKHILPKSVGMSIPWTTITHENPVEFEQRSSLVREYPFPASSEQERAEKYKALATKYGVVLAGRLAEYRYYDMDVAIENAFSIAERILAG